MSEPIKTTATDWDHKIVNATSLSLRGVIGCNDDVRRLRQQVEEGDCEDELRTACEIAVAFIRWSQDLKDRQSKLQAENQRLRELLQPIMEECKNEADYWNETWNEDYCISIGITIKEVRELAAALNTGEKHGHS